MKKIHPDKYEALRVELKALNAKYAALNELFDRLNAAYADAKKTVQKLITKRDETPPL